ncbi:MAG TPA: hypothetical protein VFD66_01090 [Verrucomicrobiae bacterium]|nr:hypothetical protein [Verrucomicrobiae bacterium]
MQEAAGGLQVGFEISRKYAKAEKDKTSGAVTVTKLSQPVVAYEAALSKDKMTGEISVSANGTVLESPNWKSKAEKD